MPYVGDDVHEARKRRWEDDPNEVYRLYTTPEKQSAFYVLNQAAQESSGNGSIMQNRKILPLSKRPRTIDDDIHIHGDFPPTHRRRTSQSRTPGPHEPNNGLENKPQAIRTGGVLLTPCHICHRKPTKKSDLDSFAECQGCGERSCFVCIRECQGWNAADGIAASVLSEQEVLSRSFHMDDADDPAPPSTHERRNQHNSNNNSNDNNSSNQTTGHKTGKGWDAGGHRAMVCSRCCIERGSEGEIVCLGCLSGMEMA